jgi:hypothetical protein
MEVSHAVILRIPHTLYYDIQSFKRHYMHVNNTDISQNHIILHLLEGVVELIQEHGLKVEELGKPLVRSPKHSFVLRVPDRVLGKLKKFHHSYCADQSFNKFVVKLIEYNLKMLMEVE